MSTRDEEEVALQAAFEQTLTGETEAAPASEPADEQEAPSEQPVAETAPGAEAEAEPPPPKYVTAEEFRALQSALEASIKKTHDKVFGRIGDLQQRIDQLRERVSSFSPAAKQNIEKEFPELAPLLFDPNADQQSGASEPVGAFDAQDIQEVIRRELEPAKLSAQHPDWREIVTSPEFQQWKLTVLPPIEAQILDQTWDSSYIGAKLNEFKAWAHGGRSQVVAAPAAVQPAPKPRLDVAVAPKGIPRGAPAMGGVDEEADAMLEAFNQSYSYNR